MSRLQFELHRVETNAWIEDKSMNGICVNGIKLGKEDQHCIDQGIVISILQKDFKVFFHEQVSHKRGKRIIVT